MDYENKPSKLFKELQLVSGFHTARSLQLYLHDLSWSCAALLSHTYAFAVCALLGSRSARQAGFPLPHSHHAPDLSSDDGNTSTNSDYTSTDEEV